MPTPTPACCGCLRHLFTLLLARAPQDRGVYFPQFEQAAYTTPVGQMARASTQRGEHLLRVNDEKWVRGFEGVGMVMSTRTQW